MKQLERNKSKYVKSWRLGTPVLHVLVAIGPLDYTDVFIPTYMYLFLHLFIYLNMSLLVNRSTNLSMLIFYTVFPPNWVFMARATFVPSCCIDPGLFHFVKTNKEKRKTTQKKPLPPSCFLNNHLASTPQPPRLTTSPPTRQRARWRQRVTCGPV